MLQQKRFGKPNQLDTGEGRGVPCGAVESARSSEGEYKMIESLKIENFRCFEKVAVKNLSKVNIIVGENGSGKTALIESIILAATGHPSIALRLRAQRGLGDMNQIAIDLTRQSFESLWKNLFFKYDQSRTVALSIKGTPENTRSARISFSAGSESLSLPLESTSDLTVIVPVLFEYKRGNADWLQFPVELKNGELKITGASETMPISYFPAYLRPNPQELAARFSQVRRKKQVKRFLSTMRKAYPDIKDMSVDVGALGISLLNVDVEYLPELTALSLYSDGAYRVANYLLAIATTERGVVMIDEIENGLYYKRLDALWPALLDFCDEYNVQLFLSTHSLECLRSAETVVKERPKDFTLLRTVHQSDQSRIVHVTGEGFRGAMDAEIEIR